MQLAEIIRILQRSNLRLLSLGDLKKLLGIKEDNTAYKTAEKLVKQEVLLRLKKGLYASSFSSPHEFEQANYLYSPSYVSLESALNYYGMLSQFPYTITSITPRKSKKIDSRQKEYEFVHCAEGLYWGYEKQNNFLIALPEKALVDEIYLVSKGLRTVSFDELDLSKINQKKFREFCGKIKYLPFNNLVQTIFKRKR
ncbi:MAG: hypothetical protein KKH83_07620 [Candidatus Margulisbacteria bacterium]|nr:hypothetical protein [Candidatus Margulisiibacteriota bacterium]